MKDKKLKKNSVWLLDIDTYLTICELAKRRGKKAGDNIEDEFKEVLSKKRKKFKLLGTTDQDVDLMTGNIREMGLKVLNLKEIQRRNR